MGKQVMRLTESDLHKIINESVQKILETINTENIQTGELNHLEESPLWPDVCGDFEKNRIHKRKVYKYLCGMFDKIMNNLTSIGLEPQVAFKALMPLQEEIKSHEEY